MARRQARPAAASRAASPALRPGLTGTRRRKRRPGPFGPEVESCQLCRRDAAGTRQNTREREVIHHPGDVHVNRSHRVGRLVRGRKRVSVLSSYSPTWFERLCSAADPVSATPNV